MKQQSAAEDLVRQAREALKRVEDEREDVRTACRVREREELAEFNWEADRLRRVIRTLTAKPRRRSTGVQAGPRALNRVRALLQRGPMPQTQIVRVTKLNGGTVSYALRALVESGEIEATGERVCGSRVFQLRGRKAA